MIEFVRRRFYLKALLVFSFFFLVFFACYFSVGTVVTSDDHFFHFRFAEVVRDKGVLDAFYDFKAIYFSKMAQGTEYFVYYNFIFFLLIVPFTLIQPLFLGIKLYGVIAAALAFTALYWSLAKFMVRKPFVMTLVAFSIAGSGLLLRFFTSRPFTLAPALLLVLLYFLHKKKYFGVFTISFLYLFWHSSTFFFPFLIIGSYALFEGFYGRKIDYKNVLWGTAGVVGAVGFAYLIAPDFLLFMYDTVFGIYRETILGSVVKIPEGNELYKAEFFDFLRGNMLLVCALFAAITVSIQQYVESKSKNAPQEDNSEGSLDLKILVGTCFLLSIAFFLGTISMSRRFQDYFTFFGALFVVLSFDNVVRHVQITSQAIKRALVAGIAVSVFYLFASNALSVQQTMGDGTSVESMRPVGEWLNKNVPPGEVIFNTSWNWFPQLYYHSPSHRYIIGLEPRFLYVYSNELYFKWSHIEEGYFCAKESCPEVVEELAGVTRRSSLHAAWYQKQGNLLADSILSDFHSSYIMTSNGMMNLNLILDNNNRFNKVLSTVGGYYIYHIKKQS